LLRRTGIVPKGRVGGGLFEFADALLLVRQSKLILNAQNARHIVF
jgi:hypothetical protein